MTHYGSIKDIGESISKLYNFMYAQRISPGKELIEVYQSIDAEGDDYVVTIEVSMQMWMRLYRINLEKNLGSELTKIIWAGGEHVQLISPY